MAGGEFVSLEVADGIGTIRLARPPMNALNRQIQEEIRACALEAGAREDIRAVIVYGGEKVFAAGADIKEMASLGYTDMALRAHELSGSFSAVAAIPKPTIAAITGYALGGGFELALCCDFRIAGDNAKVGQPEILLGIIPGAGGTQRLAERAGPARAREFVMTGGLYDAATLERWNVINRVLEDAELQEKGMKFAHSLAAGPTVAHAMTKRIVRAYLDGGIERADEVTPGVFADLFATEDLQGAVRSFLDVGPGKATFTGR